MVGSWGYTIDVCPRAMSGPRSDPFECSQPTERSRSPRCVEWAGSADGLLQPAISFPIFATLKVAEPDLIETSREQTTSIHGFIGERVCICGLANCHYSTKFFSNDAQMDSQ